MSQEPLLDELLQLAAVAGCELDRAPDVVGARRRWGEAPLVLLDEAAVAACAEARLPRRSGVLVLCSGDPPPTLWRQAFAIGAERVLALPAGEAWLLSAFADAADRPATTAGRVLAVIGGRGGAGASVLAAAVAITALRHGSALLVDCDPLGGGIDLVLGAEVEAGLRWPELRVDGGRVPVSALRSALPGRAVGESRLAVVSCDRAGPGPAPDALAAVIDAGRRAGDTVVCDLPRQQSAAADAALARADLTVIVVPAELRAAAAARRVAEGVRAHCARLAIVVRGPAPGDLGPDEVAKLVGAPLLASARSAAGLPRTLENGGLRTSLRGPLGRIANAILAAVPAPTPQAAA